MANERFLSVLSCIKSVDIVGVFFSILVFDNEADDAKRQVALFALVTIRKRLICCKDDTSS